MDYKNQLRTIFHNVNPLLVDLLQNMLKFNPSQRLTAAQCLTNPMFDDVRDMSKEAQVAS